jgi:integrator complex subunit 11
MFDCGLHMSYHDNRRFPDFKFLKNYYKKDNLNEIVDVMLLTHFHLDHCGSLPILTQRENFTNPILMSMPTKCILPYMLEDFRKVISESS